MDENRIKRISELLAQSWGRLPSQRFGQFLENFVFKGGVRGDGTSINMFMQNDEITEKRLQEFVQNAQENNLVFPDMNTEINLIKEQIGLLGALAEGDWNLERCTGKDIRKWCDRIIDGEDVREELKQILETF